MNIAVQLVHEAHKGNFDKALIITADSDLCPAIRMVKDTFPDKEIEVLVPPNRYDITREIRGLATTTSIKQRHLRKNLLPETICDNEGNVIITRPAKYDPPQSIQPATPAMGAGAQNLPQAQPAAP